MNSEFNSDDIPSTSSATNNKCRETNLEADLASITLSNDDTSTYTITPNYHFIYVYSDDSFDNDDPCTWYSFDEPLGYDNDDSDKNINENPPSPEATSVDQNDDCPSSSGQQVNVPKSINKEGNDIKRFLRGEYEKGDDFDLNSIYFLVEPRKEESITSPKQIDDVTKNKDNNVDEKVEEKKNERELSENPVNVTDPKERKLTDAVSSTNMDPGPSTSKDNGNQRSTSKTGENVRLTKNQIAEIQKTIASRMIKREKSESTSRPETPDDVPLSMVNICIDIPCVGIPSVSSNARQNTNSGIPSVSANGRQNTNSGIPSVSSNFVHTFRATSVFGGHRNREETTDEILRRLMEEGDSETDLDLADFDPGIIQFKGGYKMQKKEDSDDWESIWKSLTKNEKHTNVIKKEFKGEPPVNGEIKQERNPNINQNPQRDNMIVVYDSDDEMKNDVKVKKEEIVIEVDDSDSDDDVIPVPISPQPTRARKSRAEETPTTSAKVPRLCASCASKAALEDMSTVAVSSTSTSHTEATVPTNEERPRRGPPMVKLSNGTIISACDLMLALAEIEQLFAEGSEIRNRLDAALDALQCRTEFFASNH